MAVYFNAQQMSLADGAFRHAEQLAGRYYRLSPEAVMAHRYDIRTLAFLDRHEVDSRAFAHLCKYHYQRPDTRASSSGLHFYRVCLQDDRILDAVERAGSFIKLSPLLLYIAAHELVHIIRFEGGQIDFDAPLAEKRQEEEKVHEITQDILSQLDLPEINLVMECFSGRYQIGDICQ
jgi:hypothetical protein